jgi:hypothetical protein
MAKKQKSQREQELLLKQEREQVIDDVLRFSKKRFKKFDEVIEELYAGENLSRFFNSDVRILSISECFSRLSKKRDLPEKKLLKEVLIYLDKYSALVSAVEFIQAIYNMIQFKTWWRNNIFEWKPRSKQTQLQLKELVGYLFCKYKVPDFLCQSFYGSNLLYIEWFIHLGTGGKVKELKKVPIPFTQKMGHYFLQAPSRLTISEALRFAQVRGLGGDERIADRIALSWLGSKSFDNESFWEKFVQILVTGGMFNLSKIGELIDYVREMKRINIDYALKGRTLQSLLKQSDEWHKRSSYSGVLQYWRPSGIEGYRFEKQDGDIIVEELISTKELIKEGKTMKHCVASYAHLCAKGRTAIYSFRKYPSGLMQEVLATIEVNISLKRIVQAKGKLNKPISNEVRKCMETWAKKRELSIGTYL